MVKKDAIQKDWIQEDLYEAVNGEWEEQATIPSDKPSTGGFVTVHEEVEEILKADVEAMAQGEQEVHSPELEEMLKYYRLANDFERRDEEGATPLKSYLKKLQEIDSYEKLNNILEEWVLKGFILPFNLGVMVDFKNSEKYALGLDVPSLILPDTTYYEAEEAVALLDVYKQMADQVLELVGYSEAERSQLIAETLRFDKLLVPHQKSNEALADYTAQYNPRTKTEIGSYSEKIDFEGVINHLVSPEVDQVVVTQPEFFENFDDTLEEAGFGTLKSWLLVKFIISRTGLLSEDLRQAGSLFGLTLSGQEQPQNRKKDAFYTAINQYDQIVGIYYGKKYFGPEARSDVEHMVHEMIDVYKKRLENNEWLSDETIDKAIVKLNELGILVGYPDDFPEEYSEFIVDEEESLFTNHARFTEIAARYSFDRWNTEVDRTRWGMSANTVNAYFNPTKNIICFPAAILRAPFYDIEQSPSENYGGIGAVIAHEISHAFDNNGAKFDEKGNLENWWTEGDFEAFDKLADKVIEQWDGLETDAGPVNGTLTVSENIADAGGLACALAAVEQDADPNYREFFFNWARIWAQKAKPEYKQLLLKVDVHAPNRLRANVPPQNLDKFHEVFQTQPGDGMHMEEEDRIIIW